jgi:hypothetical protein
MHVVEPQDDPITSSLGLYLLPCSFFGLFLLACRGLGGRFALIKLKPGNYKDQLHTSECLHKHQHVDQEKVSVLNSTLLLRYSCKGRILLLHDLHHGPRTERCSYVSFSPNMSSINFHFRKYYKPNWPQIFLTRKSAPAI